MKFTPIHYLRVACHFWPWERAFWLGLMHDSIEDGWCSLYRIERWFGFEFRTDIWALSRRRCGTYADYIDWIAASNDDVIRVKRADLAENYARASSSLRKRYAKAMEKLA